MATSSTKITPNRVAAAGGVTAVLAFLLLSKKSSKTLSPEEWIRLNNPNASDIEIDMMLAVWIAWAKLQHAQSVVEDEDLPGQEEDIVTCETEAGLLRNIAIADPTPANLAAAEQKEAICAGLENDFKLSLEIILNAFENDLRAIGTVPYTPREAGTALGDAEIAYEAALATWLAKEQYIAARMAEATRQGWVWTGWDMSGSIAGVPWGSYPDIASLGVAAVSRIRSAKVLQGAKLLLYPHRDYGGTPIVLDAANGIQVNNDIYFGSGSSPTSPQSLKMEYSLQAYIDDAQNAHITCVSLWASLVGIRSAYNQLQSDVNQWKAYFALYQIFDTRAGSLLSNIQAMIDYINNSYPTQP